MAAFAIGSARISYWHDKIQAYNSAARVARERVDMDKQAMREEAERLMREAMTRKGVTVKQGDTRIMATCGKCGAQNKVSAPKGTSRVKYTCKECGVEQMAL
jgi:RNase P subunit RPR2